jgi:hypothetical protein
MVRWKAARRGAPAPGGLPQGKQPLHVTEKSVSDVDVEKTGHERSVTVPVSPPSSAGVLHVHVVQHVVIGGGDLELDGALDHGQPRWRICRPIPAVGARTGVRLAPGWHD